MRKSVTGLRAWLLQRISAVCMLLFIVFVLLHFLFDPPHSYLAWHGWIMSPGVSVAVVIFFAALSMHAWVGIRDVVIDYVRPVALRVTTLALLGFGLLAIAVWVGRMLLIGRG